MRRLPARLGEFARRDQTGESGGTNTLRLIRLDSEGGSESETKLDLG